MLFNHSRRLGIFAILLFALLGLSESVYANSQAETQSSVSSEQAPAVSEPDKPISSMGDRLRSLLGIAAFLGLCVFLSNSRSDINWRTVFWGLGLQFFLGFLILKTAAGTELTLAAKDVFQGILDYSKMGTGMVFGTLPDVEGAGFQLWIVLLGTIIFVSAVMAVLYHLGVLQFVVWCIARVMQKTMGTSGPESLAAAANIFPIRMGGGLRGGRPLVPLPPNGHDRQVVLGGQRPPRKLHYGRYRFFTVDTGCLH